MTNGLEFDPGFAPFILAFRGTVEYLYADINRFKNFSQKKIKFLQYHKKLLEILKNNIGFYTGCLMWAVYLKTQPEQEILSNPCFGSEYNEEENISDTRYIIQFLEFFPKDMKYFLGKNFEFDSNFLKLIQTYEDFLILNKGFTETKLNTDIILPKNLNTTCYDEYKTKIDEAIKSQDLSVLADCISNIIK